MTTGDPSRYLWWLVSRASGIVALVLISASVLLGLAMAARLVPPRAKRSAARLHEYLAMTSLAAIGLHGAALLGDGWLRPGLGGITVPFELTYRPAFTGIGIIGGYLALLLGPSFYLRRRLGARRWRKLHRATAIVWVLSVVHTLGAGSDASTLWLRVVVVAPAGPIIYALVVRLLSGGRERGRDRGGDRAAQAAGSPAVVAEPPPAAGARQAPPVERPSHDRRDGLARRPAWGDGAAR